ncbi:acyl-CoA reductase [Aurantibacter crassamenti]|uniref:acyl-CoA reductase n=1 Tax=Aurantibacter crassamenti TaxID=1837375 RepID=UPI0019395AB5|nr:acyl-CoA reductase [Aurantibacter crassamenti]MBM1106906.1 acyl-CoA reductase [Aurantibacter crassamenti]
MNDLNKTIIAFASLGSFLRAFLESTANEDDWSQKLEETIILAGHKNGWFTKENVVLAIESWADLLTEQELTAWLSTYNNSEVDVTPKQKTVAIIMAGNIPLVGFHDFLSVLITGNKALVKLSDSDKVLVPFLASFLIEKEPTLKDKIEFSDGKLENFDVVIATGSNNTSRYFEYYFSKKPNIIRKNRNSVAVIKGDETTSQLEALGKDIFHYYGLGCRSVSKLFVPKNYDFDILFKAIFPFGDIVNQNKYANNYDYNKAVYLMSNFAILDNGFLILKEDKSYGSPIASLNYEYYSSEESLKKRLIDDEEHLQCVVASNFLDNEIIFGETQTPKLNDYADGVDTIAFLLKT